MRKIAILGLHSDSNLGDILICRMVKTLFEQNSVEPIQWLDIDLRKYHTQFVRSRKYEKLWNTLNFLFKAITYFPIRFFYEVRVRYLSSEMASLISGSDAAVIAGGGIIHYKYHHYYAGICSFILACSRGKIPVVIHAVGVEGYDKKSPKCKMFEKYLSLPNVRIISTRDDVKSLRDFYLRRKHDIPLRKIVDSVIFCNRLQITQICQEPSAFKVGIGLIRGNILKDFGISCEGEAVCNYYCGLVMELEKRGIDFEFFTTGVIGDKIIVGRIEEKLNKHYEVRVPHSTDDLMMIVSSYRGIISARMHSCIVAYAFNRPAMALNWCEKIPLWFDNINLPEGCIPIGMKSDAIVDLFLQIEKRGYDQSRRKFLEEEFLKTLKEEMILLEIATNR